MGQLVDGVWQDTWYDTKSTGGRFKRSVSAFRNWLTADGSAGPSGEGGFAAEKDRYHLYVSLACPWAHRTLIVRTLKGLESLIPVSVVNPLMLENGWTFDKDFPAATGDDLYHHDFSINSICAPIRITLDASPFRYCGIRKTRPSSAMNRLKLSACSIPLLMLTARGRAIIIPLNCGKKLMS